MMKDSTAEALAACGRDRVMHRSGGRPAVAIRWDQELVTSEDDQKYLVVEADTFEEAGREAAQRFAGRLRRLAKYYSDQASRIEYSLSKK